MYVLVPKSVGELWAEHRIIPGPAQSPNPPHSAARPGHSGRRQRLLREVSVPPAWAPPPTADTCFPDFSYFPFLWKILPCFLQPRGPMSPSREGRAARSPGPAVWKAAGVSGTQKTTAMNFFTRERGCPALAGPALLGW